MSELVGKTLGKYQIVERVGQGGMAEVYRAFQPGLDRYVAIKVVHSFLLQDESFLSRFRREAQSVADLRHPNIIQVFDFDIQDNRPYMVLEFINGHNLGDVIDHRLDHGRTLEMSEVLWLMQALCSAVGYAHRQGIVHRDIKPANVMLTTDQRVILTDFGLVRILGGTKFTATGQITGTPEYMSPEQAHGDSGDQRADIYALGILFFEAITGAVPYVGETPVSILLKHVSYPVPSVRKLKGDVPEILEDVISKVLAKNPDDRYQTAEEFWDAIVSVFPDGGNPGKLLPNSGGHNVDRSGASYPPLPQNQPTQVQQPAVTMLAESPETVQVSRGFSLKGRGGLLISLQLALLLGLGFLLYQLQTQPPAPEIPTPKAQRPRLPADAMHALVDTGNNQLQAADFNQALETFKIVLKQEPNSVPALLGRAQANLALLRVSEAKSDIESALKIAPNDPRPKLAHARFLLEYENNVDWSSIRTQIDAAILLSPSSPEAFYTRGWATLYFSPSQKKAGDQSEFACLPDWQRAETAGSATQAIADLQKAVDLAGSHREYRLALADALYFSGNLRAAAEQAEAALALAPKYYPSRWRHGVLRYYLGEFSKASDDFTAILGASAGLSGKDRSLWYSARSLSHLKNKKIAEANEDVNAAVSADVDSPLWLYVRGKIRAAENKFEAAREDFARLAEKKPADYSCPLLNTLGAAGILPDLGTALLRTKHPAEALEKCTEAVRRDAKSAEAMLCRARAKLALKQLSAAREDFERALLLTQSDEEKSSIREEFNREFPKPTPTPLPAATPQPTRVKATPVPTPTPPPPTPTPTPQPTPTASLAPVVQGGQNDQVWGSLTVRLGSQVYTAYSVGAEKLPQMNWSLRLVGFDQLDAAPVDSRVRQGLEFEVLNLPGESVVVSLPADQTSGFGHKDSPAIVSGTFRDLYRAIPAASAPTLTERWSASFRIRVRYRGKLIAKRDIFLFRDPTSGKMVVNTPAESAPTSDDSANADTKSQGGNSSDDIKAGSEQYSGTFTPSRGQAIPFELELRYEGKAVMGKASLAGHGEFAVSGKILARGMELQLTGEQKSLRLSCGPRGNSLRGRYSFPTIEQSGRFEALKK